MLKGPAGWRWQQSCHYIHGSHCVGAETGLGVTPPLGHMVSPALLQFDCGQTTGEGETKGRDGSMRASALCAGPPGQRWREASPLFRQGETTRDQPIGKMSWVKTTGPASAQVAVLLDTYLLTALWLTTSRLGGFGSSGQ